MRDQQLKQKIMENNVKRFEDEKMQMEMENQEREIQMKREYQRQQYYDKQKAMVGEFKHFTEQTEGMLKIKKKKPSKGQAKQFQHDVMKAFAVTGVKNKHDQKFKHNPYQKAMEENQIDNQQRQSLQHEEDDGEISHEHTHTDSEDGNPAQPGNAKQNFELNGDELNEPVKFSSNVNDQSPNIQAPSSQYTPNTEQPSGIETQNAGGK